MGNIFVWVILATFASYSQALPSAKEFRWDSISAGKIVGGHDSEILPYQVSLRRYGSHICGGSIINERYVLTAAHCVDRTPTSYDTVAWGGVDKYNLAFTASVVKFICHEQYDSSTLTYDFALIEVDRNLFNGTEDARVAPIPFCSSTCTNQVSGMPVSTSGWGSLSSGGPSPILLQTVDILSVDQTECNINYAEFGYEITSSMVCAGVPEGGKDACQGDSGGPLVTKNGAGEGQDCLIGGTSWGVGCADARYPGVWSLACLFTEWIKEKTGAVVVVSS